MSSTLYTVSPQARRRGQMTLERTSMAPKPDLFHIWLIQEFLICGTLWISLSRCSTMIEFVNKSVLLADKLSADA